MLQSGNDVLDALGRAQPQNQVAIENPRTASIDVILVSSGFDIQDSIFVTQDSGFKFKVRNASNFDDCLIRNILDQAVCMMKCQKSLLFGSVSRRKVR